MQLSSVSAGANYLKHTDWWTSNGVKNDVNVAHSQYFSSVVGKILLVEPLVKGVRLRFSISSDGVWENPLIEWGGFGSTASSVYVSSDTDCTKRRVAAVQARQQRQCEKEDVDARVSSGSNFLFLQQTGCFLSTGAQVWNKKKESLDLKIQNRRNL